MIFSSKGNCRRDSRSLELFSFSLWHWFTAKHYLAPTQNVLSFKTHSSSRAETLCDHKSDLSLWMRTHRYMIQGLKAGLPHWLCIPPQISSPHRNTVCSRYAPLIMEIQNIPMSPTEENISVEFTHSIPHSLHLINYCHSSRVNFPFISPSADWWCICCEIDIYTSFLNLSKRFSL